MIIDTVCFRIETSLQRHSGMARIVNVSNGFTRAFIHEWNEPYLPLPS